MRSLNCDLCLLFLGKDAEAQGTGGDDEGVEATETGQRCREFHGQVEGEEEGLKTGSDAVFRSS